ncbi:hypothetical protein HN51_028908 [Arachis hypogaea]
MGNRISLPGELKWKEASGGTGTTARRTSTLATARRTNTLATARKTGLSRRSRCQKLQSSEFKMTTPLAAASIRDGGSFADRSSDSASIVVVTVKFVGGS